MHALIPSEPFGYSKEIIWLFFSLLYTNLRNKCVIFSPLYIVPSLRTLLNELAPVRHKCREICIQLNISNSKLHDFEKFADPFAEGLDYWLDGNTDVPITWGSVGAILTSHHVGEYVLAENLKEKWTTNKESEEIYEKTDGGE